MEAERERRLLMRERRKAGIPDPPKKPLLARAWSETAKYCTGRKVPGADYSNTP